MRLPIVIMMVILVVGCSSNSGSALSYDSVDTSSTLSATELALFSEVNDADLKIKN